MQSISGKEDKKSVSTQRFKQDYVTKIENKGSNRECITVKSSSDYGNKLKSIAEIDRKKKEEEAHWKSMYSKREYKPKEKVEVYTSDDYFSDKLERYYSSKGSKEY